MKRSLLSLILVALFTEAFAQDIAKNTVYLEAGGAAFFYSVNYERLFAQGPRHAWGARIGATYLPNFGRRDRTIGGVPLGLSFMKTLRNNLFEAGITTALLSDTSDDEPVNPGAATLNEMVWVNSLRAGFRREVVGSGLFWNVLAQFSHIRTSDANNWSGPHEDELLPFLSLGAGYSF